MPDTFHFLQPLWLLALLPMLALLWGLARPGGADNPWRRIVDAQLLPLLMAGRAGSAGRGALWLLAAGWLIAVLALANPVWERQPRPVFQTTAARVIVLDLSRSMTAPDLQPSRLARARYKVEDMLDRMGEGQTGLVVFAGDAFSVSPLTRDVNTIRALLKALDTGIMPAQGSRADLGLLKADELLRQAGLGSGEVLLVADGVDHGDPDSAERAAAQLAGNGYRVSVLGVGTAAGAPLPGGEGGPVRDAAGKVVMAALETASLQAVARAGGGAYHPISAGNNDLDLLLADRGASRVEGAAPGELKTDRWKEAGPLLAVLLLPLAALAFRRGWLLGVVLVAGTLLPPPPAHASAWDDLWVRPEQQAARALKKGDYALAAQRATDPARRGSAQYKLGDYEKALEEFSKATGADADYNRGNALAQLGRYPDAIAAYDRALQAAPDMDDARANKAAVEALLKKQQEQKPPAGSPPPQDDKNGNGGERKPDRDSPAQGGKDGKENKDNKDNKDGKQDAASAKGPPAQDKPDEPGQAQNPAPSGKSNDPGAQSGNDRQAAPDNAQQPGAKDAGPGQQNKGDDQFSQAARALENKSADAKQDDGPSAARGAAGRQAGAPAERDPRRGSALSGEAEKLSSDERLAADQWLRRIPDDPGGLLRRKFQYQYKQREQRPDTGSRQAW